MGSNLDDNLYVLILYTPSLDDLYLKLSYYYGHAGVSRSSSLGINFSS